MNGLANIDEHRQQSFDISEAMRLLVERTASHPVATVAAVRQLFVKYLNEIWITEDPPKGNFDTTALVEDLFAGRCITYRLSWHARKVIRNLFNAAVSLFGRDFRTFPEDKSLTVERILDLHRRVCAHMRNAGKLRTVLVRPNGVSETLYAPPQFVSARLDALIAFVRDQQVLHFTHSSADPNLQADVTKTWHAIRLATVFFSEFLRIHPFEDGNGRTARLLFSFLIHEWVPVPVSLVLTKDKANYIMALEQRSDLQPPRALADITMKCCVRSAAEVFELLSDETFLAFKSDIVVHTGFACWC